MNFLAPASDRLVLGLPFNRTEVIGNHRELRRSTIDDRLELPWELFEARIAQLHRGAPACIHMRVLHVSLAVAVSSMTGRVVRSHEDRIT